MKVFVYGTLKRGGVLHNSLKDCKYLGVDKIENFTMFELGWYPAVVPTLDSRESIYGEVYEIDDKILSELDAIEGKGTLYDRVKINTRFGVAMMYVYAKKNEIRTFNFPKVPYGFFKVSDKKWEILVGDDRYNGDASKVVFDMRFFDTSAGRCDTNKQYMELFAKRADGLDINTSFEDIFLTDALIQTNFVEV